ncbi:MAG: DMT family transporter [Limisphaera sp.]|nr:DMT family transporter [Limisphaera sp.]
MHSTSTARLTLGLVVATFLWGGNNTGVRYLVQDWPPVFTGCTRFFCAGVLLSLWLRRGASCQEWQPVPRGLQRSLWWRGGFSLAMYIVAFNEALRHTAASHVAVLLAAAPLWALLAEGWSGARSGFFRRWAAAMLGLAGVAILMAPAIGGNPVRWKGELLGLLASFLWAHYGWQSRWLGQRLPPAEVTAQTMWRAAVWLAPVAGAELLRQSVPWRFDLVAVQGYCVLAGGVAAFGLWTWALKHWPTSRVLLFNNLIPLTTLLWAHWLLGETVSTSFPIALVLIVAGVWLGQQAGPTATSVSGSPRSDPPVGP